MCVSVQWRIDSGIVELFVSARRRVTRRIRSPFRRTMRAEREKRHGCRCRYSVGVKAFQIYCILIYGAYQFVLCRARSAAEWIVVVCSSCDRCRDIPCKCGITIAMQFGLYCVGAGIYFGDKNEPLDLHIQA